MNGPQKAIAIQLVLGLVVVAAFATQGSEMLLSALYGWAIGVANLLLLGGTFRIANRQAADNPKQGMTILYMSAVIRFVLLAVFFALGLALFALKPMPMVLTFVVMQLGSALSLRGKRRLTD